MGEVKMTACDHCGKRVDNPCAERGWITLNGNACSPVSVSRYVGRMGPSCYESDYLRRVSDFCGVACLLAALDAKAREREDPAAKHPEDARLNHPTAKAGTVIVHGNCVRLVARERDRMRLMLGAIKAWCQRQSNAAYPERLAMHGLGELPTPPDDPHDTPPEWKGEAGGGGGVPYR